MFTFVNRNQSENRKFEEVITMENDEMKDRIAHIIRAKNLTAAEFAVRLGIQPSNISHLLSGRNNPSLDFVKKLKETFPEYSLEWIIFGRGPMTESEPFLSPKPAPGAQEQVGTEAPKPQLAEGSLFAEDAKLEEEPLIPLQKSELKRIVLVYADDTFEVLSPR